MATTSSSQSMDRSTTISHWTHGGGEFELLEGQREPEQFDVIVIGGGQAGLAVGHHLAQYGLHFLILDANQRIGDSWRRRWDSLRLFTPARYDSLPGMLFPASGHAFPTKDEMADYLEAYAAQMRLPIRTGVHVERVVPVGDGQGGYAVLAGDRRYDAAQVVVASTAHHHPKAPDFASMLDPGIRQLHSSEYRNSSQLQDGRVLVVGASNSGAEIALEVSRDHQTLLSGRDTGHVPFRIDGRPARIVVRFLWFVWDHVLTINTPMGRKMRPYVRSHGGPLVRIKPADLRAAGVERVIARTTGVQNGKPMLEDGRVLDVANVIWCTGFRNAFDWIDSLEFGDDGYPIQDKGVVSTTQGLYFVGLPFQRAFSSMLIGGVGRDAAYVADRIAARAKAEGQRHPL
jgi:putative flavoprotein involved in K+ transport